VIIDPGLDDLDDPRPVVVTEDRWGGALTVADFPTPVESLGKLKLPKFVDLRSPRVRRDLASSLRNTGVTPPSGRKKRGGSTDDAELNSLRRALRAHPCHGCDDRESHARWAERYQRLAGETAQQESKVNATTHSLARAFDRIRGLLAERGYLSEPRKTGAEQQITEHGRLLARLYSESDLLAAECLREGIWESLGPAELAAVISALVFEARRDDPTEPRVPSGPVSDALAETSRLWSELQGDERRHRLERTREPDAGFAWPVYRWARGESLQKVLTAAETSGHEISAGDFVRWCRQVIDLLDQIKDVMGKQDGIGATAGKAVEAIRRGVVAAGAV
jgi:ATP-dependent RNA helicase HelY